ncbi:hypothetical protein KVR01_009135 [Diaporthe batatas]|uniref:RNase P/RNase MRP complex subunit n=1 Tax=Diaporthe batatas TaxID=748121 RepID=UPI001D05448F|nr:RNase P/RNase MRP complex subunit [Diaporthe batatas]KAG8160871.1 hypothetical protein KVR01_009135 [Diaporthe batatas]
MHHLTLVPTLHPHTTSHNMTSKSQAVTQALLARAHSPTTAERIYSDKIQHRPLFLRPTSPPPQATARQARRKERERKAKERKKALKPKPLSATQRRKLRLYDVPRHGQKYATFLPLHHLWLGYVTELLGNEVYTGGQGAASKLSSADMHGAEVEVVRSGCVGRVGIKGIVIKDARFVFEVVTPKNKVKLVPKEGTLFRVEIPPPPPTTTGAEPTEAAGGEQATSTKSLVFEIHGDQFSVPSAERANRKFKPHFLTNV